jgi:hypothetical protein
MYQSLTMKISVREAHIVSSAVPELRRTTIKDREIIHQQNERREDLSRQQGRNVTRSSCILVTVLSLDANLLC